MNRGFFSDHGCHGNQENSVLVVSMATVVKGKNSSVYFRKLMPTSIPPESFSPKQPLFL